MAQDNAGERADGGTSTVGKRRRRIVVKVRSAISHPDRIYVVQPEAGLLGYLGDAHDFKTFTAAGAWCDEQQADPGMAFDFTIEAALVGAARQPSPVSEAGAPTEDPDADLIRMCRNLGNGVALSERETALVRFFGLATKKGEFRLTSKGVRLARRSL